VSRISSDEGLFVQGAFTLSEWWGLSSSVQKWKLLTTAKKCGSYEGSKDPKQFPEKLLSNLNGLRHPFRDGDVEVGEYESEEIPEAKSLDFTPGISWE